MAGRVYFFILFPLLFLALIYGCGDLPSGTTTKTLSSLSVSPTSATVRIGSRESFSAIATYSDGTAAPVIPSWSVSNSLGSIVAAGYTGLFTPTMVGTGSVTATYNSKSAVAALTVTASAAATVVTIEVSPSTLQARVGASQTFTATGKNASGESLSISPVWSISGETVGVFSWSGTTATLEATSEGTAVISCVSSEVAGYAYVTIEGYSLSITVESDTYVDEANILVSYEAETSVKAGYLSAAPGTHYEAYLRFNLTSIPSNVSIESAVLNVYPTSAGTPSFQLYRLNSVFSGATCWSNKPSYGSFIFSKTFTADQYNSLSGDEFLSVVRTWYLTPSANYGLAIRQDGGDNGTIVLISKENVLNPPVLSLQYKRIK